MKIRIDKLVSRALIYLNEDEAYLKNQEMLTPGALSLIDALTEIMPEVATEVAMNAERSDISEWEEGDGDLEWLEPGHGVVALPADFIRLGRFRMSDWKRAISESLEYGGAEYQLRCGDRAGNRKSPAIALRLDGGCKEIEFFGSTSSGAYLEQLFYLPMPGDGSDGTLSLPASLFDRTARAAASRLAPN